MLVLISGEYITFVSGKNIQIGEKKVCSICEFVHAHSRAQGEKPTI